HPGPVAGPRRQRRSRPGRRRADRRRSRVVTRGGAGQRRRLHPARRGGAVRPRPPHRLGGCGAAGRTVPTAPARDQPTRFRGMSTPHALPEPGPGAPTPPIGLRDGGAAATARLDATFVPVPDTLLAALEAICPVTATGDEVGEASRDWWPQAMIWALDGQVAAKAAAVVSPTTTEQVSRVLALCNEAGVPVTAAAGRSGVCGASVPVHGGVVLDMCGLTGIVDVDETSLVLDVAPGTFGDHLEAALRADHGLTLGHWPQ